MPAPSIEQELKRRARHRLIGVVMLLVLAVIFLPRLLEDKPAPTSPLAIRMQPAPPDTGAGTGEALNPRPIRPLGDAPVPEPAPFVESVPPREPLRVAELPAEPPTQGAPAPVREATPAPPPVETPSPPASQAAKAEPAAPRTASPKVAAPSPAPKPVEPKPAPKPPVQAAPQPAPKPAEAPSQPSTGAPPAPAGYVVQLAALSNADSARALVETVRGLGFPVFTDQVGALTRVRVGPYASREVAVEAAERLAAKGHAGQVLSR